jgi:hypothetical protein
MEPSAIMEIRKQLEALKQFQEKNAPKRLAYAGYVAEFMALPEESLLHNKQEFS